VNDDFDIALAEIETIVMAKRLSLQSQAVRHQALLDNLLK